MQSLDVSKGIQLFRVNKNENVKKGMIQLALKFLPKLSKKSLLIYALKTAFSTVSLLPKKKKLVMFESFNGRQYSDSPRAIYEYMKEHHPDYRLVWCADRRHLDNFEGKDIEYVKNLSLKWLFLMPRAKYWVSNSRLPQWLPKSSRTTYLQTWHGTPLKKLGLDMDEVLMPGTDTETYKKEFIYESSKWDYLISPNAYSTEIFRRAFGFKKYMIESGYPRNDILVHQHSEAFLEQLKKDAGIPQGKKVILYAPTWRDNEYHHAGAYKFTCQLDLDAMQKAYGEEYVILLRLHYLVAENLDLSKYEGFVYDLSHYEDIRNLYLISDMLITDYSSVFFDFSILEKPMFFYVYDIESYRDQLRGFYFDFETHAPGPLLKTTAEVIDSIRSIEENGFTPNQSFKETFTKWEDGEASKRVVKTIFK